MGTPMNVRDTKVKYIAGRPMQITGDVVVDVGDEVDPSLFPYLDAFISAGYLYVVHPDKGYDSLPPHVFSAVMTQAEAEQKMAGDPTEMSLDRRQAEEHRMNNEQLQKATEQARHAANRVAAGGEAPTDAETRLEDGTVATNQEHMRQAQEEGPTRYDLEAKEGVKVLEDDKDAEKVQRANKAPGTRSSRKKSDK